MSIIEQLEATGEVLSPAVRAAIQGLEALAVMVPVLQELIEEKLLAAEAKRRGISVEELIAAANAAEFPGPVLLRQDQQIFERFNGMGRSSFDKAYMAEMRNYAPELPTVTFQDTLVIHDKAHELHHVITNSQMALLVTSPDGRSYAVAVMIGRTSTPLPTRMALMQNVTRAAIDYHQAQQSGGTSTIAR